MAISEKINPVEWAERTAQRLRWAQANTADLAPAAQHAHLAGEMEHLAAELPAKAGAKRCANCWRDFPGWSALPRIFPAWIRP